MKPGSTVDQLMQVRLRLRPELRCSLQTSGREGYYQLEDPLTRRFYRLGPREWQLARRLDGHRTLGEVLLQLEQLETDGPRLPPTEACNLARWLVQAQLATVVGPLTHPLFARPPRRKPPPAWLNPAFMRIPLFNPDPWLQRSLPWLAWTLSPPAVVVWCLTCLAAIYQVAGQWSRFTAPIATILAPNNWLYLLLVWLGLKVVHEYYHGLVCRRYGGQVPVCGIALILFSPVAFMDVTSSWRFRSKWQRIFTAAAGMYAELFVASVTALVWAASDDGLLTQICHNAIVMASVSTLLFNGNFLMRFDGYYIFSDLFDLQNLYGNGQLYVRYLAHRYLLAIPTAGFPLRGLKATLVKTYGLASLVWRCLFYVGIVLAAARMFRGAGILISAVIGTLWILLPIARFVQYFVHARGDHQPRRLRFLGICAATLAALVGLLLLPWPGGVVTTGVVDYEPLAWVRAASPGFVQTLYVKAGQPVRAGDPLLTIRNPRTAIDLSDVEISIQQSEIRGRMWHGEDDYTAQQVEQKQRESLEEQRRELADKASALRVMAPMTGRVIGRELDWLQERYLQTGEEILAIGSEARKSIVVAVPQRDVEFFLKQLGTTPRVRVRGRDRRIHGAQLVKLDPRASDLPPHPALAAPHGGPLSVTMAGGQAADAAGGSMTKLVEPHFRATIALPEAEARALRAGQLARVRIGTVGETVGGHLRKWIESWVHRKLRDR